MSGPGAGWYPIYHHRNLLLKVKGGSSNPSIHIISGQIIKYFTNLNLAAIKGDDFPIKNHDSRVRENSEVVMKFTHIYGDTVGCHFSYIFHGSAPETKEMLPVVFHSTRPSFLTNDKRFLENSLKRNPQKKRYRTSVSRMISR